MTNERHFDVKTKRKGSKVIGHKITERVKELSVWEKLFWFIIGFLISAGIFNVI